MSEDVYFWAKVVALVISAVLSASFIIIFLVKILVKRNKISDVGNKRNKISDVGNLKKLDDYFGEISFLHDENKNKIDKKRIKRGLEKNLRFLYSTWFYVSLFTFGISFLSIFETRQLRDIKEGNWFETKWSRNKLDSSCFFVTAEVEKENADYERKRIITTSKDSLPFSLYLKYKKNGAGINFRCPIYDTITVNFIKFDEAKLEPFQILDSLKPVSLKTIITYSKASSELDTLKETYYKETLNLSVKEKEIIEKSSRLDSLKKEITYSNGLPKLNFLKNIHSKGLLELDSLKNTYYEKSLEVDSLRKIIKYSKDLIFKCDTTKDAEVVCLISSKKFAEDYKKYLDLNSLKINFNDLDSNNLKDTLKKKLDDLEWATSHPCNIGDTIVYFVYPLKITLRKSKKGIELNCIISREKNSDLEGLKYRVDVEKKGHAIKEDTNEYVHIIKRSFPKDSVHYRSFFDDDSLKYKKTILDTLLKEIVIVDQEKQIKIKDLEITKNWYSTISSILSLLANVFLLLFFGFLNTKTDIFSKNENKLGVYELYRIFVIGIFLIIILVLLLNSAYPWYSNYSPIFSESFLFVIHLIIALTSIIAIFGCWGSMNNSYTCFPWWFKLCMFLYAMMHFFELNIHYEEEFNKVAVLVLYAVGLVAKVLIIKILLFWAPENKRIMWFFLTAVNNFRTEEDYDDFVKIFDIYELKQENAELNDLSAKLKQKPLAETLFKLKRENVELKQKFDDLSPDLRILKEMIKCNIEKNDKKVQK